MSHTEQSGVTAPSVDRQLLRLRPQRLFIRFLFVESKFHLHFAAQGLARKIGQHSADLHKAPHKALIVLRRYHGLGFRLGRTGALGGSGTRGVRGCLGENDGDRKDT